MDLTYPWILSTTVIRIRSFLWYIHLILPTRFSRLTLSCLGVSYLPTQASYDMHRASQALAEVVPEGVHQSYRTLADYSGVSHSTLQRCEAGRRSIEEQAQSQLDLWSIESKAVTKFCLHMSDLG
jgi:hypothetical protein